MIVKAYKLKWKESKHLQVCGQRKGHLVHRKSQASQSQDLQDAKAIEKVK